MPPLLCPHLHGLVVGAARKVIIQVDQSIGVHRVAVALAITVRHKYAAIPGHGDGAAVVFPGAVGSVQRRVVVGHVIHLTVGGVVNMQRVRCALQEHQPVCFAGTPIPAVRRG